jgi:hypothetical protein
MAQVPTLGRLSSDVIQAHNICSTDWSAAKTDSLPGVMVQAHEIVSACLSMSDTTGKQEFRTFLCVHS